MTKPNLPISVLLVSPDIIGHGGMSSVAQAMVSDTHLSREFEISHASTHPGVGERSATSAVKSVCLTLKVCAGIARTPPDIVHIMVGPRLSLWRKTLVAAVARSRGSRVLTHVHSGAVDRAFMGESVPGVSTVALTLITHLSHGLAFLWSGPIVATQVKHPGCCVFLVANTAPTCGHADVNTQRNSTGIVFAGRLVDEKGAEFLAELVEQCSRDHADWTWTIAGEPGDEQGRRAWGRLDASRSVTLLGWVDADQVNSLLRTNNVMVLPSAVESLPMAVLAAAVCGCQVLATPVGALPELLAEGRGVLLPLNVADWEHALHEVLENGSDTGACALNAYVEEFYSRSMVANQITEAYRAILKSRNRT